MFGSGKNAPLDGIGIQFVTDIHGSQIMYPNDFGDRLTFSSSNKTRLTILSFRKMSFKILNRFPMKFVTDIHSPLGMNCSNFVM